MAKSTKFLGLQNRVERLAEKYSERPIVNPYSPRLSALPCPAPAWSRFFRLKDALIHAHDNGTEELRVFAVEPTSISKSCGKREYIVSSYEEFWFYYSKLKQMDRHFYEVIEEGAACHLYFDLEFSPESNPQLDGDFLTTQFVLFVCEKISETFGVKCSKRHVLELDSTNRLKFSKHLIFHLPHAAFRCAYDVGNFVKHLLQESGNRFSVMNSDGGVISFIDCSVYSKNRNFRLYQSCKKGKQTILSRAIHCEFNLSHENPRSSCCVYHSPKKLATPSKKQKHCNPSTDELVFYASLVTNVRYQESMKILTFVTPDEPPRSSNTMKIISSEDKDNYSKKSPFPALQNFILSLIQGDENSGFVTKWVFFPCNHTVIYSIGGNRFCGNVGRQHKSNHIYYVADLSSKTCYQMCHDPVCKSQGYRSLSVPLPKHVYDDVLDRDFDVDDDELLNFVDSLDEKCETKDENCNEWGNVADSDLLEVLTKLDT